MLTLEVEGEEVPHLAALARRVREPGGISRSLPLQLVMNHFFLFAGYASSSYSTPAKYATYCKRGCGSLSPAVFIPLPAPPSGIAYKVPSTANGTAESLS